MCCARQKDERQGRWQERCITGLHALREAKSIRGPNGIAHHNMAVDQSGIAIRGPIAHHDVAVDRDGVAIRGPKWGCSSRHGSGTLLMQMQSPGHLSSGSQKQQPHGEALLTRMKRVQHNAAPRLLGDAQVSLAQKECLQQCRQTERFTLVRLQGSLDAQACPFKSQTYSKHNIAGGLVAFDPNIKAGPSNISLYSQATACMCRDLQPFAHKALCTVSRAGKKGTKHIVPLVLMP
eukprot:1151888-Pelagomonas_calceolata.AAC.2